MSKRSILNIIKWIIAPTLFFSDRYKCASQTKKERGTHVKILNKLYFSIAIILVIGVGIFPLVQLPISILRGVVAFIGIYCLSRCNEVFMAFVKDVFDKLNSIKRDKNGLEYYERIQLALRSYVELVINYSVLYYLIDTYGGIIGLKSPFFNQAIQNIGDALYFSVITIASIGYGDFYPVHPLTRALVMYEVVNGTLLLVVSFTVYVSLTLGEKEA